MTDQTKKQNIGKPPVYSGFMRYFPRAIKAVAHVSDYGRGKYNVTWDERGFRDVGPLDLKDAQCRHILDEVIEGEFNGRDGQVLHQAQVAWDALAALENRLAEWEAEGWDLDTVMRSFTEEELDARAEIVDFASIVNPDEEPDVPAPHIPLRNTTPVMARPLYPDDEIGENKDD